MVKITSLLAIYNDSMSVETGYQLCGEFQINLLSDSGTDLDLSNIPFLTYDNTTQELQLQSKSASEARVYNY